MKKSLESLKRINSTRLSDFEKNKIKGGNFTLEEFYSINTSLTHTSSVKSCDSTSICMNDGAEVRSLGDLSREDLDILVGISELSNEDYKVFVNTWENLKM